VRRGTRTVIVALLILVALLASGCAGFNKAFGQREAVVHFQPGTPEAVRTQVRAACSHIPQATPEPLPTDHKASDELNDVRYRIDKASDGQVIALQNCLGKFRTVQGVDIPQDDNG
jgi:hypothetical protein